MGSRTANLVATALLVALGALAVACGGDGIDVPAQAGSGDASEGGARLAAYQHYGTTLAYLSGGRPATAMLEAYVKECRDKVLAADLDKGRAEFIKQYPAITKHKIEGVQFGSSLKVETEGNDYKVTVPGTKDALLLVDGKWVNGHEYYVAQGLEQPSDGDATETIRLTREGNRLLIANCDGLTRLAGFQAKPAGTPTPAPARTPLASAGTPAPGTTTTPRAGTPVSSADIVPFTKGYVRTMWGFLAGTSTARALYDLFTPECQRMVSLTSLEKTPSVLQTLYKGLQGKTVEDVEFVQNLGVKPTGAGGASLEVRLPLSSQTRLRIEGAWLTEFEWRRQMNPLMAVDASEVLELAPVGDSFRVSSCGDLTQWDRR